MAFFLAFITEVDDFIALELLAADDFIGLELLPAAGRFKTELEAHGRFITGSFFPSILPRRFCMTKSNAFTSCAT